MVMPKLSNQAGQYIRDLITTVVRTVNSDYNSIPLKPDYILKVIPDVDAELSIVNGSELLTALVAADQTKVCIHHGVDDDFPVAILTRVEVDDGENIAYANGMVERLDGAITTNEISILSPIRSNELVYTITANDLDGHSQEVGTFSVVNISYFELEGYLTFYVGRVYVTAKMYLKI